MKVIGKQASNKLLANTTSEVNGQMGRWADGQMIIINHNIGYGCHLI